ncbi:MAG: hypothetical protein Q8Q12_00615 [bacterium]|nr:hypothetical protein [bacterium]
MNWNAVLTPSEFKETIEIILQRFPTAKFSDATKDAWYSDVCHVHAGRLKKLAYAFCERFPEKNIGRLNIAGVLRSLNKSIPYSEADGRTNEGEWPSVELDGPKSCPFCGGRKMVTVEVQYADMPENWPYYIRLHCVCDRPLRPPMNLLCRIKLQDAVPDYRQRRITKGRIWSAEPQHSSEVMFLVQPIAKKVRVPFETIRIAGESGAVLNTEKGEVLHEAS